MTLIATADAAQANRRRATAGDGMVFWHTLYLGTTRYNMAQGETDPSPDTLFPMAFLVEQDAGEVANAHFHQVDQFQVIVGGEGTMGTHAVRPFCVHFAGAYTAYGPIHAGPAGVTYFTLRNGFDPGARYMMHSENRSVLRAVRRRRHREAVAGPLDVSGAGTVIPPEADGLAVWQYRLAAGETLIGPAPPAGRGQYWLVIDGSARRAGAMIGRLSCIFVMPDDDPFTVIAEADGVSLLAMQFPKLG